VITCSKVTESIDKERLGMHRRLVIGAAVLATASSATHVSPRFSWDHVPVYQHLANPNATSAEPFSSRGLRLSRSW
jgi:hypothetical protein